MGGRFILGGGGRNLWRNQWETNTEGDDEHTDGAQTGWTFECVRGYALLMLAVWTGRGAQAASERASERPSGPTGRRAAPIWAGRVGP